jgi:hypothetical protein
MHVMKHDLNRSFGMWHVWGGGRREMQMGFWWRNVKHESQVVKCYTNNYRANITNSRN